MVGMAFISVITLISGRSAVQTMFDQLKPNTALQLSKIPLAGKDAGVEFNTI